MYHYFPDKRAFFAAVVKYEAERLIEATSHLPLPARHCSKKCARVCSPTWSTSNSIRTPRGLPTSASADPTRYCSASTMKPRTVNSSMS
ncbi:tetR-family transcriptional regulator [Mycobacterium xenopi 4042]|uniref:TetR-family transcriptional regulator n=1 Tax=Mycobacterium xenopi 4042 TaxID=1299334 RepID=X7YIG8_MYCXE|nr:tetR-family transcriptional regulator [Mycobacterium xenopi 4042]